MFVIKMLDGEEVRESRGDILTLNHETGVLTVSRIDGSKETTTHYSPAKWGSVTHQIQRTLVSATPYSRLGSA
ncbi:MAG TPA: hypothetical protein VE197_05095 [Mycobacterium sp.]|jgi:hypothetical protein|nr:hypothetical protein [Mycobacterium sp.]